MGAVLTAWHIAFYFCLSVWMVSNLSLLDIQRVFGVVEASPKASWAFHSGALHTGTEPHC